MVDSSLKKYRLEFRDGFSCSVDNINGDLIHAWGRELNETVKRLCIIENLEKKRFAFCWTDLVRIQEL